MNDHTGTVIGVDIESNNELSRLSNSSFSMSSNNLLSRIFSSPLHSNWNKREKVFVTLFRSNRYCMYSSGLSGSIGLAKSIEMLLGYVLVSK